MAMEEFNLAAIPDDVADEIRKYHKAQGNTVHTMIGIWPLGGAYHYDTFLADVTNNEMPTYHTLSMMVIDYRANSVAEKLHMGYSAWMLEINNALALYQKHGMRHPNALTLEQRKEIECANIAHPYLRRQRFWQDKGLQDYARPEATVVVQ